MQANKKQPLSHSQFHKFQFIGQFDLQQVSSPAPTMDYEQLNKLNFSGVITKGNGFFDFAALRSE